MADWSRVSHTVGAFGPRIRSVPGRTLGLGRRRRRAGVGAGGAGRAGTAGGGTGVDRSSDVSADGGMVDGGGADGVDRSSDVSAAGRGGAGVAGGVAGAER